MGPSRTADDWTLHRLRVALDALRAEGMAFSAAWKLATQAALADLPSRAAREQWRCVLRFAEPHWRSAYERRSNGRALALMRWD